MRVKFASFGRSAVAAAALAIGATGIAATPVLAKDKEAAPAKPANSPEFGKAAGPFQKALLELDGQKTKLAPDDLKAKATALIPQLATVEASVKTPLDRIIYGQWAYSLGNMAGDPATTTKGLQNMLASGQLPPEKALLVSTILGQSAYTAKDYPAAIKILGPLVTNPAIQDVAVEMAAESYASSGQPKEGLEALKSAIAARKAAKVAVPDEWYSRGKQIAFNGKLGAESVEWGMLQVQVTPTPINWLGATELVLYNQTNFTSQEELDVYRLMDTTGALGLEPKFTDRKYVAYVQLIDPRRYPGEAVRIAEQGIATGALKANDTFVKDALTQARPRVAADKAGLPGLAKEAVSAASGKVPLAAADAFLSYGDAAKADELYTLALAKGGIDADKDRALTRLGMAQIGEGKYADAKATLAKVGGNRVIIAQLWSIYADQKAAGK
jgi:tetratricopeptide (TPR) repeat protein